MSVIKAGTTLTTAYTVEADTTGALEFKTGPSATLAMSISSSGVVTFPATTGFDIASANITNLTSGTTSATVLRSASGTITNLLATTATVSASTYLATASGNVGIGTGSPDQKLVVTGQQRILSDLATFSSSGKGLELFFSSGDDTGYFQSYDRATSAFKGITVRALQVNFTSGASGANTLLFDSSGNLGLGVTPSAWGAPLNKGAFQLGSGSGRPTLSITTYDSASVASGYIYNNAFWDGSNWKYMASTFSAGYEINANAGRHVWRTAASGTAGNTATFTTALLLNANGNLVLQGGTESSSGVGVTFPATQSASSNANCLDDYEEGTYTPTVVVVTGTPSYNYQQGYYTKIGRQVFGGGIIGVTNSNNLTGNIRISLPFTASAGSYGYTGGTVSDGSGFTFPISNGFYNVYLQASDADSTLTYIGVGTTATTVAYTTSGVASEWYFRFMFSYYT